MSCTTVKANPTTQQTIANGQRPIHACPVPSGGRCEPGRHRRSHARTPGEVVHASAAPITPVTPHAAICQGVHGPCPKKKLDASPAIAPTAKPGPPPSA